MHILTALRRYAAADDPHVAAANLIAMVLAWNTPFYPLYLLGTAGVSMHPGGWLTLAVFPVFLAVPAVTRRYPLGGRVLLAGAGLLNTVFCTWLLGEAAGAQLFLLPCIILAPLLFPRTERMLLLTFLALPILVGLALDNRLPNSPFMCTAQTCSSILWLNAFSVGLLTAFLGYIAAGLIGRVETSSSNVTRRGEDHSTIQPLP